MNQCEIEGERDALKRLQAETAAELDAYGFNAKKDLLAQLLALNQEVPAKIDRAETVPKYYPGPQKLVTEDCIKPIPASVAQK